MRNEGMFWIVNAPNGDVYRIYDLEKAEEKYDELYPNKILVDTKQSEVRK